MRTIITWRPSPASNADCSHETLSQICAAVLSGRVGRPGAGAGDELRRIAGSGLHAARSADDVRRPEGCRRRRLDVRTPSRTPRPVRVADLRKGARASRRSAFRSAERRPLRPEQHGHPEGDRGLFHRRRRTLHDPPAVRAQQTHGCRSGVPRAEFQGQPYDLRRSARHALDASDGAGERPLRGISAGCGGFALAGRDADRQRLRAGDRLPRRHRSRLRRRLPKRRPSVVLPRRPDPSCSRRMGYDRRMGLGAQPGDGLPRNRRGCRCRARGGHRSFAPREGRAVGGSRRYAFRPGRIQRFGVRRRGIGPASVCGDGGPDKPAFPAIGSATITNATPATRTRCPWISTNSSR